MTTINCDINHIEHGIENLNSNDDINYMSVWDSDCVMRGISTGEMKERGILSTDPDQVCTLEHSVYNSFKFKFHQSQVEFGMTFHFSPHDSARCAKPQELGEKLEEVVNQLDSISQDIGWDFAGVQAQSFGQDGKLTDFEFEYDMILY